MRYLPHDTSDREVMLKAIGAAQVEELFADIPSSARLQQDLELPAHQSELAVERRLGQMAARNMTAASVPFFIGGGAYHHHVPASVDHLIQRSEFLTSYTPYQPEVSQGTLQYLFEFQSQVAALTGMDVANASMYDGSTACGEAVLMAQRITKRNKALLCGGLHPHYSDVVKTIAHYNESEVLQLPPVPLGGEDILSHMDENTACVVLQVPNFFGEVEDFSGLIKDIQAKGALVIIVVTEIIALGALKSPGALGADIVVAEGQSIGNGLNFGGPYVGLFATKQKYVRQMPGRVCGETVDADGKRGFVLTLSTREQHIRREKATSNICTNSGLCALAFTIHLSLLGEKGLRQMAMANHRKALKLESALLEIDGVEIISDKFFNELTVKTPKPGAEIIERLAEKNILAGIAASRFYANERELENMIILAATEMTQDEDIKALQVALREVLS